MSDVDWREVENIMRRSITSVSMPSPSEQTLLLTAFKLHPDGYRELHKRVKEEAIEEIKNPYRTAAKVPYDEGELIGLLRKLDNHLSAGPIHFSAPSLEQRLADKADEADYFRQLIAEYCEDKGPCEHSMGMGMAGDDDSYCDEEDCPYCRLVRKSLSYHGRTNGTQKENSDNV